MIAADRRGAVDGTNRPVGARRRKTLPLVGAAVAAGLVLAGCSIGSPSDVAVVDGTSISKADLTNSETGAKAVGEQLSNDQLLSVLIQGAVADHVAQRRGIEITDADRDKQLNPAVLQVPSAHDLAYTLADIQIVTNQVGKKGFTKAIRKADIKVNPRYGSWTQKKSLAVTPGTGSLSQAS